MAFVSNPAQQPDKSIFDANGKQTYLGNSFIYPIDGVSLSGTSEHPVILITNPVINLKALFLSQRKIASDDAAANVIVRYYVNPTVASIGVQHVVTRADSGSDLQSTYWTFHNASGAGFYVWNNVAGGGVNPAPAGLTGIAVAFAANASANTVAADIRAAINGASAGVVASGATNVVIITNSVAGGFIPAADSAAATSFTFSVTAGLGSIVTPLNLRPASANASVSACYLSPAPSSNGTFFTSLVSVVSTEVTSSVLFILDPGESLLITGQASVGGTGVYLENTWYEI